MTVKNKMMNLLLYSTVLTSSWGQTVYADENTISDADDAFGITTGQESIGIYNERSVRGFDLSAAGNYRINGTYFVKSSGTSNFFVKKTNVKIGYGAIGTNFPGPSGVIDYTLRDPAAGEGNMIKVGIESYRNPVIDILFKNRAEDNSYSYSVGLGLQTESGDAQGGTGKSALLAGTARFSPSKDSKIQVFFGEFDYERNGQFNISLASEATKLPSELKRESYLGQDWAVEKGQRRIAGALWDSRLSKAWSIGATAVFSQDDPTVAYTQLLSDLRDDGTVNASYVIAPQQRFTAWSGEVRSRWQSKNHWINQQVQMVVRGRSSKNKFGGEQIIDLGTTTLGLKMAQTVKPEFENFSANLRDEIEQISAGVTYSALIKDKLRVDMGLLYTDYQKIFTQSDGTETGNQTSPLLYNWNLLYQLSGKMKVYASYTRGLEESGIAPSSATNRNTVLNAGIASQKEIGIRYQLAPHLNVILGSFETSRPYAGINQSNGHFETVGRVTHKGVELSIAGNVTDSLSIITGGVYTDASISFDRLSEGLVGNKPVGVPKWKLIGNLMYTPAFMPQVSVDVGANYVGARAVRSQLQQESGQQLTLPSSFTVDGGIRYRFGKSEQAPTLRLQILNLFNSYDWNVTSSETLTYSAPRRARLLLTTTF